MLQDEVQDRQFPEYRRKEIEVAASFVRKMWTAHPEYIRGAMDMFRAILTIPKGALKGQEETDYIERLIKKDFARFEMEYLKRAIRDE